MQNKKVIFLLFCTFPFLIYLVVIAFHCGRCFPQTGWTGTLLGHLQGALWLCRECYELIAYFYLSSSKLGVFEILTACRCFHKVSGKSRGGIPKIFS